MTINLQLTLADVNVILEALGEMPARVSMGTIARVRGQADRQVPRPPEQPATQPDASTGAEPQA